MSLRWMDHDPEARFMAYIDRLAASLGHADRIAPFRDYCTGLLLPGGRKSVEPMAARLAPERTSAAHQSLLHFVGQSPWSHAALLRAVRETVLPVMTQDQAVAAWMVDDTSFPKKGRHSVGVARQYSGEVGKQDNCQVAVSVSIATSQASLPVDWRLYLPRNWAHDRARRKQAGVPEEVAFQTKPQIALEQLGGLLAADVPPAPVLADAGYGSDAAFRDGLRALGLDYVVAMVGTATVWRPEATPAVPAWRGVGKRPKRLRRGGDDAPVIQLRALARELPATAWRTVAWREGAAEPLTSRFAALRVRDAHDAHRSSAPRPEEWLLIEWPWDHEEPFKFWFATLPEHTALEELVYLAKMRWMIERDYLELKQEIGLGHYEGRGWRGFHHHAALCTAAYGFLLLQRAAFPPSAKTRAGLVQELAISKRPAPRESSGPAGTSRAGFDCHTEMPNCRSAAANIAAMSLLHPTDTAKQAKGAFMTQ